MFGYLSGQDGAILPAQDCPFCSCNKTSLKSKWVHESFLSQNIFRDSKKFFCDLSVRMELENKRKPKASMRMKTKKAKMLMTFKITFCNKNWMDSTIHWINHYPLDNSIIDFACVYPLDSLLFGG